MKKKIVATLLTTAMATVAIAGYCTTVNAASDFSGKKFAIVIRNSGNPYAEKEASGFQEVIEAAGAECIVKAPEGSSGLTVCCEAHRPGPSFRNV